MNSSSAAKTILFLLVIAFIGLVFFTSTSDISRTRVDQPSFSEFMAKVDAGDIKEVIMYLSANSYELQGEYKNPANRRFQLTIAKEEAPGVTSALRDKAVQIKIKDAHGSDWIMLLLPYLPLILIVGFSFFLFRVMKTNPSRTVTGIGYDLHRLAEGRKLIVGGIELPFDKGPVGHSDGDVLAHALCDGLLGAAGLGDIGTHFPDTDPQWKGANSLLFLEHAKKLLADKNFAIEHIDAVVITEKPKLGPHFPKMREALAKALGVSADKIHLKAKTNEGVDAIGRGEAIAAHVVATLSSR